MATVVDRHTLVPLGSGTSDGVVRSLRQSDRRNAPSVKASSRKSSAVSTVSTDVETLSGRQSQVSERTSSASSRVKSGSSGKRIRGHDFQMPTLYSSSPTPLAQMGFAGK